MTPTYLTTAEAAAYLRYRTPAGIRAAVMRGELAPIASDRAEPFFFLGAREN